MKNFGKLAITREEIRLGEDIKDEKGNIVQPANTVKINVLKDKDGVEWHELFKRYPHKFYIAVDDNKHIISMTDDPEQSQIAGFDIIGIDENYGETFGQGGSVYGKLWDGEKIVAPAPIAPDSISRRQFFQQASLSKLIDEEDALEAMGGRLPQVLLDSVSKLPVDYQFGAKALLVGAQTFERSNTLTPIIAKSLGLDQEQTEHFWDAASKL